MNTRSAVSEQLIEVFSSSNIFYLQQIPVMLHKLSSATQALNTNEESKYVQSDCRQNNIAKKLAK
jgi:hypothetical protein